MRGDIKSNTQLFNICLTKDHLNYNRCCRLMDSSTEEVELRSLRGKFIYNRTYPRGPTHIF